MGMANNRLVDRQMLGVAEAQLARVAGQGSRRPRLSRRAGRGFDPHAARNLADAVHLLCSLYGRHPGLLDMALEPQPERPGRRLAAGSGRRLRARAAVRRPPDLRGRPLAEHARRGRDRSRLARPAPRDRNPGQIRAARLRAWRRDRLRRRLARRPADARPRGGPGRGRMPGRRSCPTTTSIARVIDAASDGPASERALGFGGEQLLLQHRGLFDLLEARAAASATTN